MTAPVPLRVALISDTHLPALIRDLAALWPQAAQFLSGVDLILHAGDVTAPSVLAWLEQFAPVVVARGNNDDFEHPHMKPVQTLELESWRIGMAHDLAPESRPLPLIRDRVFGDGVEIMIGGHTHLERIEQRDGLVLINAGSPTLPHHKETRLGCAGLLEITRERFSASILPLGHTAGRPNPTQPLSLTVTRSAP